MVPRPTRATIHQLHCREFNQEYDLLNKSCDTPLCVLHHMWVGGSWPGFGNSSAVYGESIVRYYVDGEKDAGLVVPLNLNQIMLDDNGPWAAGGLFGKTGSPSGLWNTFAIPFNSVRVTVTLKGPTGGSTDFWYVLSALQCCSCSPGTRAAADLCSIQDHFKRAQQCLAHLTRSRLPYSAPVHCQAP